MDDAIFTFLQMIPCLHSHPILPIDSAFLSPWYILYTHRAQALNLLKVTPEDLEYPTVLTADQLVNYVENRLYFTWENKFDYHPTALAADVDHLSRAYATLGYLSAGAKQRDEDAL